MKSKYKLSSILVQALFLLEPGLALADGQGNCTVNVVRRLLTEPRGEPPNLERAFKEIKKLEKFPFEEAGGHWVKTSDGSYIHTWFEPALLPNGTLKMTPSPSVVILPGLSGRSRDTYLSGYVDELRLQGLNVGFVEGNGDGWTELYRHWRIRHEGLIQPDRYSVSDQARNVVEAVDGLQRTLRANGRLTGNSTFSLVGNSYGAWVAQKVASGPEKDFFHKHILLGPGTESLHRSTPGVRELENFVDCLADQQQCTAVPFQMLSDFFALPFKFTRNASRAMMETQMDRHLPTFFKSHFPIFANDSIRLEAAVRKFKGIWTFDTKKVAKDMRGVTLITAKHDSVMPAKEGIIVHDELGTALKESKDFGGYLEIGDADHDFLSTGKRDPIFNRTAVLIGNVIRGDGPIANMPADGSKMIMESLEDMTIRPAASFETKKRSPNIMIEATKIQTLKTLKQFNDMKTFMIEGPKAQSDAH